MVAEGLNVFDTTWILHYNYLGPLNPSFAISLSSCIHLAQLAGTPVVVLAAVVADLVALVVLYKGF